MFKRTIHRKIHVDLPGVEETRKHVAVLRFRIELSRYRGEWGRL